MAAASATSSIKVGPLVAGVDFRNPVVFAKEAATIDLLSEGRFMMALGAGWLKDDYAIAGIQQDDALTRIERLGEAIDVMRGLWGEGKFSYEGKHYTVAEVDGKPAPVSDIPILVGGGGEKILSQAAQKADIVGINPTIVARSINPKSMATAAADVVDQKLAWVKAAAGDRFDDLDLQMQVFVTAVTDDPAPIAENLSKAFGLPPEVVLQAPYFQLGTIDSIVENLQGLRERWGISYIGVSVDALDAMAPVVSRLAGS